MPNLDDLYHRGVEDVDVACADHAARLAVDEPDGVRSNLEGFELRFALSDGRVGNDFLVRPDDLKAIIVADKVDHGGIAGLNILDALLDVALKEFKLVDAKVIAESLKLTLNGFPSMEMSLNVMFT